MKRLAMVLVAVLLLGGCAWLALGPDATTDEKARAGISDALDTLDIGLTTASTYVKINPTRRSEYQTQVLPLLSVGVDVIGDAIKTGEAGGKINGSQIAMQASVYAIRVAAIVASWQGLKEAPKKRAMKAGITPTWPDLQGKQLALAKRIQDEMAVSAKVKK